MGFSCSPLWCNTYLLYYELTFVMRIAKLGRVDLMAKFQSAFRYIDDLYWLNVGNPREFLCPSEPRLESNPIWVYLLNVLEIKYKVSKFAVSDSACSIKAHFMILEIELYEHQPGAYETCKFDK